MELTNEQIENLAALTKLELDDNQKKKIKKNLENVLGYMDKLKEIDTDNIKSTTHIFENYNVFREDEVVNPQMHKELLENAPSKKEGLFIVPKTVE